MRRVFTGLTVLLALLAASLGATWWTAVRPWTTLPAERDAIDARWQDVVAWAAPLDSGVEAGNARLGADAGKGRASLAAARTAIGAVRIDVENIVAPNGMIAGAERDALPEGARTALEALRAWDAAGGALHGDPCGDVNGGGTDSIATLTLVKTTISVADSPSDPDLLAGLRLARAMRRNGTLLEATVGATLARAFAETANARRWPATETLGLLRPRPEELFAALARDASCVERMLDGNAELSSGTPKAVRVLGPKGEAAFLARERLVFRDWHGRRLADLYPRREDLDAVAATLRVPDVNALPKSVALRMSIVNGTSIVQQWKDAIAADRAYFKEGADRSFSGPIAHEADAIAALRRVWDTELASVLGPAPKAADAAAPPTARRETCRAEAARVVETLGRPAVAAHTVHGAIDAVERDGDCWSILDTGRTGGVLGVVDAETGAALLVWRVPEG